MRPFTVDSCDAEPTLNHLAEVCLQILTPIDFIAIFVIYSRRNFVYLTANTTVSSWKVYRVVTNLHLNRSPAGPSQSNG
jgi:hypothetical protein